MDESRSVRFLGLLRVLVRHEIDFLMVGGVAAQLEGAPILTLDLDSSSIRRPTISLACSARSASSRPANANRQGGTSSRIQTSSTMRTHLFMTELGALRAIGNGLTYHDLADRTVRYELAELSVRVLELAAVIESREQANREKDRAALPVLRQTLALKARQGRDGE